MKCFSDVFRDCTKYATKIKTSEYKEKGKYIIVDQGQSTISGYTDLEEGLFKDVPAIIFGDHTRVIKYIDQPFFLGADGAKLLKTDSPNSNYKFLYYALKSVKIPNTGYNRHFKWLKEAKFNYPDTEKQGKIVSTLDNIQKVIEVREKQLEQLDLLIKSRFVEMFGDPIKNQFGWEQTNLKNIGIGKLTYGSGASAIDYDGNCRYIRITDIANNGLLNNEKKSPSIFDEKYLLHSGDILFARSGATVGKTFLYDEKKHGKSVYAGYLIKLTPDLTKVNSQYVFWFTNTYYYKSFVQSVQKAVAQPNINAQEYGNLTICLPPLELQNKFAQFVEQVEKTKAQVQKSLDEAQLLFNSLMQEYFG